jgi:hypothetical protein
MLAAAHVLPHPGGNFAAKIRELGRVFVQVEIHVRLLFLE